MDKRQYLKHFFVLMSGTGAAQLVTFLSYPILARLYAPGDFGVLALFTTAVTILGVIACFRFEITIPIAPRRSRFALLWLCTLLSAAVGVVSAAGYAVWNPGQGVLFPLLLGASVFLTGFTSAATLFLLRYDRYAGVSNSAVLRTAGAAVVQIAFAFVAPTETGLIAGYAAGLLLQAAVMGWMLHRMGPWRIPGRAHMAAAVARYRGQATVDVPSSFLNAVNANIVNITLALLFNETVVGYYALANRLVVVPLKTFNDGLSRVYFQKAAQAQERTGTFWNELKFSLLISGAASAGVLIGLWAFAPTLIPLYLGPEWVPSAEMLVIMAPMLTIRSIAQSIGTTVFVLARAQWRLYHNLVVLALHGAAFGAAYGLGASLEEYFWLFTAMVGLESAVYATILVLAARRGKGTSRAPDVRSGPVRS